MIDFTAEEIQEYAAAIKAVETELAEAQLQAEDDNVRKMARAIGPEATLGFLVWQRMNRIKKGRINQ